MKWIDRRELTALVFHNIGNRDGIIDIRFTR